MKDVINYEVLGDSVSGHVQRIVRKGLDMTVGYMAGSNIFDGSTVEAVGEVTSGAPNAIGGIIGMVVVSIVSYVWSTGRARLLHKYGRR